MFHCLGICVKTVFLVQHFNQKYQYFMGDLYNCNPVEHPKTQYIIYYYILIESKKMTLKDYVDYATRFKLGYDQFESVFPSSIFK